MWTDTDQQPKVTQYLERQSRSQQLEDAFRAFNQLSEQLSESYQQLQQRVVQLNEELAAARTERMRQLAEKERLANRLSLLLDVLPAAVVVLDGEDAIRQFNPAACELLPAIAPGLPWVALFRESVAEQREGEEYVLRNGRVAGLLERSLAPESGRILLLIDVTETRELQERVIRQERLSALGEMAAQLAHQIRTPLASALLDAAHLARDDLPEGRRQQFSSRLKARLGHLERQIRDMLVFARGSRFVPEPVEVLPLLQELGQVIEPMLQARQAGFELQDRTVEPLWISGNRDALLGALMNLATNALEQGGQGVRLRIELDKTPNERLEIRFCDNGPGVAEELVGRIFDPFFTTRSDGTGLGLAVVQSVVLAHEGRISVQRSAEGGACFHVRLPLMRMGAGEGTMVPDFSTAEHGVVASDRLRSVS